ncbi:hypothetical protein QFC19_001639 [Naganishia cerealis]|uniref:Uncharacterized protein n=1 Tax=Naganishia cerealis TaxID=610337 RepID=A0ACC2WGQ2_9TREE|nr:hypothetical protein QFC19_001639 [Naganishia cerealis]
MGIARDSRHKRSASGARRAQYRKKRKFELGRQPAMTKLGPKRIHEVRVRGGNTKHRAMRLDSGNFAWGSEHCTRKTRVIDVVRINQSLLLGEGGKGSREIRGGWQRLMIYNATNNELLRTKTLVKGAVVEIDAAPFRQWYEAHYATPVFRGAKPTEADATTGEGEKKQSNHVQRILTERKKDAKIEPALESRFKQGRLFAVISSRPGQSGRCDGYVLEGKELEFYQRRMNLRKAKHAA